MQMRYSTQPRDQKYIKEYGFLSLAKKSVGKYSKKLMVTATMTAKNRGMDAAKTTSERVVQKRQR